MKNIIIIGYAEKNLRAYRKQLNVIFENHINVDVLLIKEINTCNFDNYDMILVPNTDTLVEFNSKGLVAKTLIYEKTISSDCLKVFKKLDTDKRIFIVDENKNIAKDVCNNILKLGYNFNITPINYFELENLVPDILLTYSKDTIKEPCIQYDIGEILIDLTTIVEVGMRLNKESCIRENDVLNIYKNTVTSKIGLDMMLRKLSKYESIVLILFKIIDKGYAEIDLNMNLYFCNHKAINILGVDPDNYKHISIKEYIGEEIINAVYNEKQSFVNEVININGGDIVYSLYPNVEVDKFFGATIVFTEFNETEKIQNEIRNKVIKKGHRAKYTFEDIIGESEEIKECVEKAKLLAQSESSIVIEGETGTGKEVLSQAVHNYSKRKNAQFVAINCSALPVNILESELFGYEEGAFTGAKKGGKIGLFELADNGTIFLDEIEEMPLEIQAKLLRVLQEKEIMRIGGDTVKRIDIRVIAATNENLEEMVEEGNFRRDLYYRLKVLPIVIPPLRDRGVDIILLHDYFKKKLGGIYKLDTEMKRKLLAYPWKGNVRELQNFVEYSISLKKRVITEKDSPFVYKVRKSKDITSTYEKFLDSCGSDIYKYRCVLEVFYKAHLSKIRIGRRSIFDEVKNMDVFITEPEIRGMLKKLEEFGIVSVGRGRAGSQITNFGLQVYNVIISA